MNLIKQSFQIGDKLPKHLYIKRVSDYAFMDWPLKFESNYDIIGNVQTFKTFSLNFTSKTSGYSTYDSISYDCSSEFVDVDYDSLSDEEIVALDEELEQFRSENDFYQSYLAKRTETHKSGVVNYSTSLFSYEGESNQDFSISDYNDDFIVVDLTNLANEELYLTEQSEGDTIIYVDVDELSTSEEEPTPEPEPSDSELIELTLEDFVDRVVELNNIPRNFYFKEKTPESYLFLIRTTAEGDDYFTVNELDALGLHTFDDWDLPQVLDRDIPNWRDILTYHLFLDLSKDINGLNFSLELGCHNADELISQITPGEREWTEDEFNFLIDTFDIQQIGYHAGDEPQSNIFISVDTYNYNGEDYVHFKLEDPYIDVLNRLGVSEEMGYHWIYNVEEGPLYISESEPTPEPEPEPTPEPEPEPTPVEPVIKSNYALIADSIRAKTGKTALMTAAQMPDEIASIPTAAPVIEGRLNLQEGATCSYDGFIFVTDGGSFNNGTYTIHVGRVNVSKSACPSKEYELHMRMEDGTEVISLALLFTGTSAENFVMTSTGSSYADDLSMCSYATIEEVE